jgi:DNA-binding NarL/FixJ family response regulator
MNSMWQSTMLRPANASSQKQSIPKSEKPLDTFGLDQRAIPLVGEREILGLLTEGPTTKQIAKRLNISMKAVESHKGNLRRKLGIYTISALIQFALDKGLTFCEPLGSSGGASPG